MVESYEATFEIPEEDVQAYQELLKIAPRVVFDTTKLRERLEELENQDGKNKKTTQI